MKQATELKKIAPLLFSLIVLLSGVCYAADAHLDDAHLNELIFIKGGCFEMGDIFGDGDWPERPVHKACVDDFYLGRYEVTNREFTDFLNRFGSVKTREGQLIIKIGGSFKGERCRIKKNGAKFSVEPGYEDYPVIYVTWYGITEYSNFNGLRLPTETEWEYAAREGGKRMKYSWGNGHPNDRRVANIPDESVPEKVPGWNVLNWKAWPGYNDGFPYLAPVGSFEPNSFGLYDMTGNVWEWTVDLYDNKFFRKAPERNPVSREGETYVMKGGSWLSQLFELRISTRARHYPDAYYATWGFRVARDAGK